MIDRQTGNIILSNTRHIKAGDAFDVIEPLHLGEFQQISDRQNGWRWLTAKNLHLEENYFIVSFGFYSSALKLIDLIVSKDRFDLTATWENWSEEDELSSLKKMRNWLKKELGREGAFDWGDVSAGYDRKTGSSSISIRYK